MEGEGRRSPASFEREQLDQALEILGREERLGRLPHARRRWFRSLVVYGYTVPVLASLLALLAGTHELAAHWQTAGERWPALLDAELRVFVGTVLVFGPLNVLAALSLFPLSAPLLFRAWRWRRRVSAAGLSASLRAPWEKERARHRVRNALTLLLGPWLVGWGLVFALLRPLSTFQDPLVHDAPLHWVPFSPGWVLGSALFMLPIGFHYVALHFLLRDMERVAVVRRLIHELRGQREGLTRRASDESVLLGSAFRQAERIERAQIARERLATLRSFRAGGAADYQVRKSADFRAALAALEDARQVRVHDAILGLASAPHSGRARELGSAPRWIDVRDTELELRYDVDDARAELIVSGLRSRAAGRGTAT